MDLLKHLQGKAKTETLDADSYQNLDNAAALMKIISIGYQDIQKGNVVAHEDLKTRISSILN